MYGKLNLDNEDDKAKIVLGRKEGVMRSIAKLDRHWEINCEAFFFYCPTCNLPFKLSDEGHDCIYALNLEKDSLEVTLEILKENIKELRKKEALIDKDTID